MLLDNKEFAFTFHSHILHQLRLRSILPQAGKLFDILQLQCKRLDI